MFLSQRTDVFPSIHAKTLAWYTRNAAGAHDNLLYFPRRLNRNRFTKSQGHDSIAIYSPLTAYPCLAKHTSVPLTHHFSSINFLLAHSAIPSFIHGSCFSPTTAAPAPSYASPYFFNIRPPLLVRNSPDPINPLQHLTRSRLERRRTPTCKADNQ